MKQSKAYGANLADGNSIFVDLAQLRLIFCVFQFSLRALFSSIYRHHASDVRKNIQNYHLNGMYGAISFCICFHFVSKMAEIIVCAQVGSVQCVHLTDVLLIFLFVFNFQPRVKVAVPLDRLR